MIYKSRVAVHSPIGRRIYTAHAQLAAAMVRRGEADYESPGVIMLTQTVRLTDEMTRPLIGKWRVPHCDSSSGDAGRGSAAVVPAHSLHYQATAGQTPVLTNCGKTCGWQRHVSG